VASFLCESLNCSLPPRKNPLRNDFSPGPDYGTITTFASKLRPGELRTHKMETTTVQPSFDPSGAQKTQTGALITLTSLFFMWGFVTVLNDILSPHLQSIFSLSYKQASLVQVAFFFAYFIFSIPAAKLIDATSYKTSIVIGLLTMGVGAFLFIPAATAASYPLFSRRADGPRRRHYCSPGRCQSLRSCARPGKDRFQPLEPHPGF